MKIVYNIIKGDDNVFLDLGKQIVNVDTAICFNLRSEKSINVVSKLGNSFFVRYDDDNAKDRFEEIEKEMQSGKKFPFDSLVYCNIGNPQVCCFLLFLLVSNYIKNLSRLFVKFYHW